MILERDLDSDAQALHHSPFSLAFEQAERELGALIGYPALVYAETERALLPIVPHGANRFEIQADGRRRAVFDRLSDAEMFCDSEATIQALREQLASADEHIGAFIAAYQHEQAAADRYEATRGTEDWEAAGLALEQAGIATARCLSAARAWLRRRG
jgi:hypothetical protein